MNKKLNDTFIEGIIKKFREQFVASDNRFLTGTETVGNAEKFIRQSFKSSLQEQRQSILEEIENKIKIERKWAMPNKWTFTIKPIKELLKEEVTDGLWCDPFAGMNSPAQVTNDLNPEMPTTYHLPALEFLKGLDNESFDGVLYDPPYSPRQVKECYNNIAIDGWDKKWDGRTTFWSETMDEVARILKPNGKLICFGWTSMGGSKSRGFEMNRILLVPHGGRKNDTIVTVEIKRKLTPNKDNKE